MVLSRTDLLAQQDPYLSTLLPPGALAKEVLSTLVSSFNIRLYHSQSIQYYLFKK